ncbi:MAG: hypothetical protein IPH12_09615 [Saprospirales bacterium]|nr:hypothetical protein [Saprospirales bacterium]
MNISTEILLQLRKYAKGELSPGERSAVEELLSRHPELGAELESTRQLIQAAERLERQRLVQLIVEIEARADRKGWLQALRVAISGAWRRFAGYLTMPPRVPKLSLGSYRCSAVGSHCRLLVVSPVIGCIVYI